MLITLVGLNHATAPLALRERMSYSDGTRAAALQKLKQFCAEAVILDTCNRSELYALTRDTQDSISTLTLFLTSFHQQPIATLQPYLYARTNQSAIAHLFNVASGADSLVIGEAQVLAQVRAAFEFAARHQACGPIFSALFRHALVTGKRARSETHIARGSLSLSSLAIDGAQQLMGTLDGRVALLIGAGKMSALAARYLRAFGVRRVWVANRTLANAQQLANEIDGTAIPFEQVSDALRTCDLVFTSTAAPHVILTHELMAEVMRARTQPICIVDLALLRDVEPSVAQLPNVHLIDLDDLQRIAQHNLAERRAEVCKVQAIVDEETNQFWRWLQSLSVAPTVSALRQHAEQIRQSELADHLSRLPNLSAHERKVIESMTASIVGRFLHEPTLRLKARARDGDGIAYAATLRELFGLDNHDEI